MRTLSLLLCTSLAVFIAMPVLALECANSGTAPGVAPDDTGDGHATACGGSSVAGGAESTALGVIATSTGDFSTAVGHQAYSLGESSLALGMLASSAGNGSTALGLESSAPGGNSTALGAYAFASQPNTVILGSIAGVNFAANYANVGMGTSTPAQAVDVERSGAAARFQLTSFTAAVEEAPQYIQRRARGTTDAPTAVQNGDNLGLFSFRGHNGTAMGGSRATITAQAAGNFSGTSTPTRLIFATTPVGQTTPQQVLVITPDGKVQVNGQNLAVPDYVFEDDYELMPLDELKAFIDQNGHLPGIASAEQVRVEGVDLAGAQMSQLQKIEELTLYTLQLQGRIAELEEQQGRIAELEVLLNRALASLD